MNIQAFPRPLGANSYGENDSQKGMSLLDYFAAHAMMALFVDRPTEHIDIRAEQAYKIAEQMLIERKKYEHLS